MIVLYAFMTEADRKQVEALARGLEETAGAAAHAVAVSAAAQSFCAGIPATSPDHGRPDHIVLHERQAGGHAESRIAALRRRCRAVLDRDPFLSLRTLRGIALNALYYRRRRREAARYIARHGIDVVVTGNDTNPMILPVLAGAHRQGCRTVLARGAQIFHHRTDEGCRHSWKHAMRASMTGMNLDRPPSFAARLCGYWVARCSPENVEHTVWGRLGAYLPIDLAALKIAGCLPGNLWHLGTPWTDLILASGADEAEALEQYGIAENRVAVIGSIVFQQIHAQLRRRDAVRRSVCEALGLAADRPVVMVTVTASWEHHNATHEQQFGYLDRLFGVLGASGAQIVASLHPLSRAGDYRELKAKHGFAILDRSLFDCIAIADVFIGSDYSSVVRWGIAAGIPTMNMEFNPHGLDVGLHPDYPNITDFATFAAWLDAALADAPIPSERLVATQPAVLGLVRDGRFFEHLVREIEALPRTGPHRQGASPTRESAPVGAAVGPAAASPIREDANH